MADQDRSGRSMGKYSAKLEVAGSERVASGHKGSGKKVVMFVPEGVDVKDNLDIEVVALDPATFEAMAQRRC